VECEAKLSYALLHGTDPQLVTLNVLHRAGITTYRQLFAILSERSPLPEQRWIDAVLLQTEPPLDPSLVPFEATATPQQVARDFDWSVLVNRIAAGNSSQWELTLNDSSPSGIPDLESADPSLGCDDRPLKYRKSDDDGHPDVDENDRSARPSNTTQGFACTTVPTNCTNQRLMQNVGSFQSRRRVVMNTCLCF